MVLIANYLEHNLKNISIAMMLKSVKFYSNFYLFDIMLLFFGLVSWWTASGTVV